MILLLLTVLAGSASASSLRISKAVQDVDALFAVTERLSKDLQRAPLPAEWPEILVTAPSPAGAWQGPYVGQVSCDPWNNPYLLRTEVAGPGTFGVYSMGVNGIDEHGAGDDVSSWAGFDRRFYRVNELSILDVLIPVALLLLIAMGWYLLRRTRFRLRGR